MRHDISHEKEENETQAPHIITHNDKNYIHIPETTSFQNVNNAQEPPQGFYTLLKKLSPETYRTMSLRYAMPEQLTIIGGASRKRIYRAVQLHHTTPPITPYIENTILPALQYLAERAANQRDIPEQFNAARWAVRQKHGKEYNNCEIDNLAAALFNYCGIAPDFDKHKMQGTSIHRITPDTEGITIEIGKPHTLQFRFNAGILEIDLLIHANMQRNDVIINPTPLKKAAMRIFYACNGWFLSISEKYHMSVFAAYGEYIKEKLNAFSETERPAIPEIIIPADMLPPQKIHLPYADFIKTEVSAAQLKQRQGNAYNALYKASLEKAKRLPLVENFFTTSQLEKVGLYGKSLKSAKDRGIIIYLDWGKFEFSADFWEAIQQ
jgi:hypothetical protein